MSAAQNTPGVATGADTTCIYRWEDEFAGGDPTDDTWKTFGRDVTIDTLEGSNNAVRVFDPGSREAREIIETNFDGSVSISFTLSNPWWLPAVISDATTEGEGTPYTHTFGGQMPRSMEILSGLKKRDEERTLLGAVFPTVTITPTTNEEVNVSLDGAYADEDLDVDVAELVEQVEGSVRPYTYAQAELHLAGEPLRLIQEASLTIENNIEIVPELGTRLGVDFSAGERNPSINHSGLIRDDTKDKLQRMYGGGAATGPQEVMDNDEEIRLKFGHKEDVGGESLEFVLGSAKTDSHSRSGTGADPNTNLQDELDEMATTIEAIAENDEAEAL